MIVASNRSDSSMSRPRPAPPVVVVEIAQKISPTPFATVVRHNANCGYHQHDHAGSHTQPGVVQVSLLRFIQIAALSRGRCGFQ